MAQRKWRGNSVSALHTRRPAGLGGLVGLDLQSLNRGNRKLKGFSR